MKRTRKWQFVAQEATRLADLGLTPLEISKRIGVRRSTVQRWMASGRLKDTRKGTRAKRLPSIVKIKPSQWASTVRREYQLDATDDQLVTAAETALGISLDALQSASVRLAAMGRFQSIAKQLALVARAADAEQELPGKPAERERPKPVPARSSRPAVDPRRTLMAVK